VSGAKKILLSYYYHSDKNFIDIKKKFFKNGVRVFADSGGFTAETKGVDIDIAHYCKWIEDNTEHLECYANLDVIGNQVLTRRNQDIMEEMCLSPIPVFHVGSGLKEFRRLCEKYDYIAIGGMVPYMKRLKDIYPFLQKIFDIAGGKKLHGFGCTNFKAVFDFPWYSVDSATWLVGIRYGEVPIFDKKNHKIKRISFSDWEEWRKHRRMIERLGFDWREVASNRVLNKTTLLNLCRASFEEIEEYLTEKWGI
jgi:hypothetical protein